MTPRNRNAAALRYVVDLPTRVAADLERAGQLNTALGDLCLVLATKVVDDMFTDGPRIAAAAQLAALLDKIGTGSVEGGDAIDRIRKMRVV